MTLNAAQDESYMSSQSKKSQVGLMPTQDGINGSLVTAGNDALIAAGRDVNQVSSHIVTVPDYLQLHFAQQVREAFSFLVDEGFTEIEESPTRMLTRMIYRNGDIKVMYPRQSRGLEIA